MDARKNDLDFLSAIFSDETQQYRAPAEPERGDRVTIRLRVPRVRAALAVSLILEGAPSPLPMEETAQGTEHFCLYQAQLTCGDTPIRYYFQIKRGRETYFYQKNGAYRQTRYLKPDPRFRFRILPGFHTPAWSQGAVQYQIFTDRFRNGDKTNDVQYAEYSYNKQHVRQIPDWGRMPAEDDYRCFYGGDIAGILEKLDYLQDLGVEVLYLNPIFLAPSNHKYDTQDYEHIDPHFGVIEDDIDYTMQHWEHHNGYAQRYITRVLSKKNLEKSDALFATLCRELHKRGMKIILDGVFNHCGSFHRWMDREGIYRDKPGYAPGAYQDEESPYRGFFRFLWENKGQYEAWWGVETLPKLNYEGSRELWETIFAIAEKWLKPPYCIDGWRLDVAADLGHTPETNHAFWQEFRRRVKAVNPDAVIIAEHYGDPSAWLQGDQWDSVMNYDAFMDPLSYFLTGIEKHSDGIRDDLYQDGEKFLESIQENMARFQWSSLQCAMNELSNHDHSRFLTRTNRRVGRMHTLGSQAADRDVDKAVMREAVAIQMTWPGAPTIYYGDEAGLTGWTDPDNRRTYPWGHEDADLIAFHKALTRLRRARPVLRSGSFKSLGGGNAWMAFARFDESDRVITVCNNSAAPLLLTLRLRDAGAEDGETYAQILGTDKSGFTCVETDAGVVEKGEISLTLPPRSVSILAPKTEIR